MFANGYFNVMLFMDIGYTHKCKYTYLFIPRLWRDRFQSCPNPRRVIAKDVESCNYCCYVGCLTLIVRVGDSALAPNRHNSLSCTVRTSIQRSWNQRVGCLLWSMTLIYDLWNMYVDKRKVRGLVPCCGQESTMAIKYKYCHTP